MQILVVPLTLEASYAIRTECAPSDNPNVALDYGASGTAASYTATAYKYLRYYACPEPTLDRLAARP